MVGNEITLIKAVEGFEANSYAILYSPKKCYLALFDGANFADENGEIEESEILNVYEARVFNFTKELRWVKGCEAKTLADTDFPNCEKNDQNYLLWGKKNGASLNGWTQFAEARIGAFYVPVTLTNKEYAVFEAVEYLKEFEDGNVAVFEERLTGISEVK